MGLVGYENLVYNNLAVLVGIFIYGVSFCLSPNAFILRMAGEMSSRIEKDLSSIRAVERKGGKGV